MTIQLQNSLLLIGHIKTENGSLRMVFLIPYGSSVFSREWTFPQRSFSCGIITNIAFENGSIVVPKTCVAWLTKVLSAEVLGV